MKTGGEYLLFLKKWQYTNFVRYNPYYRNKDLYVFTHNNALDKFEIKKALFSKMVNSDVGLKYGQVKDYEFFAYSKEELGKYNQLKEKVLKWILSR